MRGINGNRAYWNSRYSKEGKIWGISPSKSSLYALKLFKKYPIVHILIPGSGYGRHTKLFSENKYKVVGIEISEVAFEISKNFDTTSTFINCSLLEIDTLDKIFDAIYCFNTIHLFLKEERMLFLSKCKELLKHNGIAFFTAFSEEESSFSKGKKVEEYTFESKTGRPTHYFSKNDILDHFKHFNIIETGIMEEPENHGESGPHIHRLRYILAQKLDY